MEVKWFFSGSARAVLDENFSNEYYVGNRFHFVILASRVAADLIEEIFLNKFMLNLISPSTMYPWKT